MLFKQFLGLTFSALLGVTPISFISADNPLTRVDSVNWRTWYEVSDLGDQASIGTDAHYYTVAFHTEVYCSYPCSFVKTNVSVTPIQVSDSHFTLSYTIRYGPKKPQEFYNLINAFNDSSVVAGYQSETHTYTSYDETATMQLNSYFFNSSGSAAAYTIYVGFPARTYLDSIASNVRDLSNFYYIKNFLDDDDVPSSYIQTVTNYIEDGDYSSAIEYIENYYIDNSVTETEYNETVINQYESKETDLKTVTDTEHNFSIGIEDDFNNQIQAIDTENSVISNSSFQQSALWVTDKFNRFTDNNAFGSILGFSLLLGLAMAIIGRVIK